MEPEENNIVFHITPEQAEVICRYSGVNIAEIEDNYEICELLDTIIDNLEV